MVKTWRQITFQRGPCLRGEILEVYESFGNAVQDY